MHTSLATIEKSIFTQRCSVDSDSLSSSFTFFFVFHVFGKALKLKCTHTHAREFGYIQKWELEYANRVQRNTKCNKNDCAREKKRVCV